MAKKRNFLLPTMALTGLLAVSGCDPEENTHADMQDKIIEMIGKDANLQERLIEMLGQDSALHAKIVEMLFERIQEDGLLSQLTPQQRTEHDMLTAHRLQNPGDQTSAQYDSEGNFHATITKPDGTTTEIERNPAAAHFEQQQRLKEAFNESQRNERTVPLTPEQQSARDSLRMSGR
jgi:pyrroline-5-carboxylate reductase